MSGKNTLSFGILLLPLVVAATAHAGDPRCFMHGIIVPTAGEKAQLSDLLRLHFDADNKKKCEALMSAYCQYNIREKEYSPERLKGSWKEDSAKAEEVNYTFSPKCKIVPEKDE